MHQRVTSVVCIQINIWLDAKKNLTLLCILPEDVGLFAETYVGFENTFYTCQYLVGWFSLTINALYTEYKTRIQAAQDPPCVLDTNRQKI
jgi:hypothetical protein